MKLLIAVLALVALAGCGRAPQDYKFVRIRGCEYIVNNGLWAESSTLTHAGDCDNPIHKEARP